MQGNLAIILYLEEGEQQKKQRKVVI